MNFFNSHMFQPEKKDVSSTGSSSESRSEDWETMRQRFQIVICVLVEIVKMKKGKLTAYVAKKSMLSIRFFTTSKLSMTSCVKNWKLSV